MRNYNFIEGVNIIAKHIPEDQIDSFGVNAEHNQLWFGSHEWVTDEKDVARLEELGWFEDEGAWSCWA